MSIRYVDTARGTEHDQPRICDRWTHHTPSRSYAVRQRFSKRIEKCFGWGKTIGDLQKSRFVGSQKLHFQFVLTFAAYNLVRMRNLGVVSC